MLKINRISEPQPAPLRLRDLQPGDVFWQPMFGRDKLYMVCSASAFLTLKDFVQDSYKNSDGMVLTVLLNYNMGPIVCSFDGGQSVMLVDATLMVAE